MSMLDDFVEQSAGPSSGIARGNDRYGRSNGGWSPTAGTGFENVEYEGFEPDEDDEPDEDQGMVRAMETGFIPSSRLQTSLPPLFSLSLVQYTPPAAILSLVTANNLLVLALYPLSIVIINLNRPDELVTVDLPRPAPEKGSSAPVVNPVIEKLFIDPTARHLLITTDSGDTFYLPISPGNAAVQSRRPRPLRLRQSITAVAWSPYSGPSTETASGTDGQPAKTDAITPPSTDVLLGTVSGHVLSLPLPPQDDIFKSVSISMSKPLERDLQTVYALPDQQPVTGLAFGFWSDTERKGKRRAWVIITTRERVYEVQGSVTTTSAGGKTGGWAEEVFKPVRNTALKFQELPGDPPNPELRIYTALTDSNTGKLAPPSAFAWITGPGLYTSPLSSTPASEIIVKPSLFPYPSPSNAAPPPAFSRAAISPGTSPTSIPLSATITQYHYLLLYADRVVGVSREEEKVVWEESLPLSGNEKAIGLSSDPIGQTFWIHTDKSILEVLIRDEDRDVWRGKLSRGDFTDALAFARTKAQKDVVLSKQGDSLFEQGRFIQAAQAYAKSSRSFEYVTLKFIDTDERDALRIYLSDRLDLLDRKDRTQRMMLATWLIEIYLSKCNDLEDIVAAESAVSDVESLSVERQIMEEDIRNFMTTYSSDLDAKVVYELILSHGREDLYLFYAGLMRNHGKVVEHWVTEESWSKAIDILNRQDSLDLYYRFASVLMQNSPKATVDAWLRRPELSPRRLIPALLQGPTRSASSDVTDQAIRYLSSVIFSQSSTDAIIHNLLLTLYATSPAKDDGQLLKFLSSVPDDPATERPYYDLDYALRVCKSHGRIQACVHIYSKMGMYESSVDLALQKGDLELAKINADRPEDDDVLRKKLWLKIAKYVVQEKKDIKSAMLFLEATDLLKVEDVLPFFPDFVVIDDFKAEICTALEQYAARIDELRAEMNEATQSAESIKRDIEALSNRFVTVEPGDKCWRCGLALSLRQFYVFPCQHTFHADCMISVAMEFLPAPSLRRILHLQNELIKQDPAPRILLSQTYPSTPGTPTAASRAKARDLPATSGNAAADLLLGVTGRNKLLAAGDKLRDLIIPDALAQAVTAVGTTVVSGVNAVGGIGAGGGGNQKKSKKERDRDDSRIAAARKELDDLVAGVCPLCEGAVVGLDRPFIKEDEAVDDWAI